MKRTLIPAAIVLAVSLVGVASIAAAQEKGTGEIKLIAPTGGSESPKKSSPRGNKPIKTVASAANAVTTAATGSLSVVAEPGATIYLEMIGGKPEDDRKGLLAAEKRQFVFNRLKPGRYRVSAELDGYEDPEVRDGERIVEIKAGEPDGLEFKLRRITYKVVIKTNAKTGTIKYSPKGGLSRMEVAITNGRATLPDLAAGSHEIEIQTAEIGYLPIKRTIEIGPGRIEFEATLEKRLSEGTFSHMWTSKDGWDTPNSWSAAGGILRVNSPGIALPINESYRYYADFELTCDVKLVNDIGASFVLRALDKNNYYLIQLTGAKAAKPYELHSFIVKNGVSQPLQAPISIAGVAPNITGKIFEVTIKFIENKMNILVNDSDTGEIIPLGNLTDFNRTFPVGACGIAARGQEQVEIARFVVTPALKKE